MVRGVIRAPLGGTIPLYRKDEKRSFNAGKKVAKISLTGTTSSAKGFL